MNCKSIILLIVVLLFWGNAEARKKKGKKVEEVQTESAYRKFFKGKACETAKGMITLHKMDGRVYFEIPLALMGREMLMGSTISEITNNGFGNVGEKPKGLLYISFVRCDSVISLKQLTAQYDTNEENLKQRIKESTIPATIKNFKITTYNEDSTAVVIDMTDYLVSADEAIDPFSPWAPILAGGERVMEKEFRRENSQVVSIKAFEDNVSVKSSLTYGLSLKNKVMYIFQREPFTAVMTRSFILLPEHPMRPRLADPRIAIFSQGVSVFNGDSRGAQARYYAQRWNLEPKDMEQYRKGVLTEPKKPIVFYVDDAFPAMWKEPVRKAALRWNVAFEKIGLKNVIQVRDFPKDDPTFDPDNLKYSCIRYVPAAITNAMGPSWTDPRTGEIINASVIIFNDVVKLANQWRFLQTSQVDPSVRTKKMPDNILEESIEYIVAHEVGHTLGLMHNMSASAAYPVDSLRSAKFTQKYGTTPSIMDYARFNYVAQPEDKGVKLTPPNLGIYDEYVIKWLYSPLYGLSAKEEQAMLESWIDEHAGDPIYRYGKQQVIARYDPSALEEDLGDDAIKAGDYGIKNLKYIVANMNDWFVDDTDGSHRENLYNELGNQYYRYLKNVMHNVGGIYLTEVKPGTAGKTFQSVPKELQRNSFVWVIKQLKNSDWLHNTGLTDQFGLRVALPPIVCYYTATELLGTYKNVVLSAHVSQDPYTLKAYFDDLYNHVWENAIKGRKPTSGEKILQRLVVDQAADVITKKSKLVKVLADPDEGLGMENAFMPSVDEIVAYGLDPTGLVGQYQNELRELEQVHGKGLVAKQLTSFGHGYDWQYRVNTRTIDDSKTYFYAYALRVKNLLNSRLASADSDTKAHYQTMLYALDEALNALNKK